MTEHEVFYDAEIAPALLDLANKCAARDIAFLAVVEYEPEKHAETRHLGKTPGLAITMLAHYAKNVFGILKYCKEKNIDVSASVILNQWSKVND